MTALQSTLCLPGLVGLVEGRFGGRREFAAMIRKVFAAAVLAGWREMILSDPDFADWPLDEHGVTQALHDWSETGRKLTMMAATYDTLLRRHARFVSWRRTWSHIVECRAGKAISADSVPSALWTPVWAFERLDVRRCTGVASSDVARCVLIKERLNERLLTSSPAFPASVLGL